MKNSASSLIGFFALFVSMSVVLSNWTGRVWINSPLMLVSSAAIAFLLFRKAGMPETKIAKLVYLGFAAAFALGAFSMIFVHPFYPVSADALHVVHTRIITDVIPQSYMPYSGLAFTYQTGFALFSNIFTDIVYFAPDYLVVWFLGLLFSSLQTILVYLVASKFFPLRIAAISSLLFIGTKTVFQSMFFGVYPLNMAIFLFLFSFYLFIERSRLCYVTLAAMLAAHPFGIFLWAMFFPLYSFLNSRVKEFLFSVPPVILLSMPSLLTTYSVVGGNAPSLAGFMETRFFPAVAALPLWAGGLVFLLALSATALILIERKFTKNSVYWVVCSAVSLLLFLAAHMTGYQHAEKFIVPVTYSFLFFSLFLFSLRQNILAGKRYYYAAGMILVLSIALFFSSSELRHGMGLDSMEPSPERKLSPVEGAFAERYREFDPELKKTLFVTHASSWSAILSNKIPFSVRNAHLVPDSEAQILDGKEWEQIVQEDILWKRIRDGCVECMEGLDVSYIAVNGNIYPSHIDYLDSKNYERVFEYGGFVVYAGS